MDAARREQGFGEMVQIGLDAVTADAEPQVRK
jgi:hypothetical protein